MQPVIFKRIYVDIPEDQARALKIRAATEGVTIRKLVENAIHSTYMKAETSSKRKEKR